MHRTRLYTRILSVDDIRDGIEIFSCKYKYVHIIITENRKNTWLT